MEGCGGESGGFGGFVVDATDGRFVEMLMLAQFSLTLILCPCCSCWR